MQLLPQPRICLIIWGTERIEILLLTAETVWTETWDSKSSCRPCSITSEASLSSCTSHTAEAWSALGRLLLPNSYVRKFGSFGLGSGSSPYGEQIADYVHIQEKRVTHTKKCMQAWPTVGQPRGQKMYMGTRRRGEGSFRCAVCPSGGTYSRNIRNAIITTDNKIVSLSEMQRRRIKYSTRSGEAEDR